MFEFPKRRSPRRNLALLGSFTLHGVLLFLVLYHPPAFVKPSSVAWGRHGASETVVYFAPRLETAKNAHPKLQFKRKNKNKPVVAPPPPPVETARAGSPNGSLFTGSSTGQEATPAIPFRFPDPEVYPWQVSGVQGDVVVEITIDQQGTVTDTKLLQSLKKDVDDKCVATVRNWRFRPAMLDGMAISSRQDVHFHFPS